MNMRDSPRTAVPVVLLLTAFVAGCNRSGQRTETTAPVSNHSVLTRSELRAITPGRNTLDAVRILRPRWLTATHGQWAPTVVIGNVPSGGVEALQHVHIGQIKELRYVNARDATTRWGINHSGGVIEVILGDFIGGFGQGTETDAAKATGRLQRS